MKGISAIIAVILLLLITIAVVGFAFVFFSRITSTAGSAAENQTQQQLIQFSKQLNIDTFNSTSVVVRNTGTGNMDTSEIAVYVDGAPKTCVWSGGGSTMPPSSVRTCLLAPGVCNPGSKFRVTGPSNSVDQAC